MKKRLLSILLVAAMVVAMVPALIVSTSAYDSGYQYGELLLQLDNLAASSVTYNPYNVVLSNGGAVESGFGTDKSVITSTTTNSWGAVQLITDLPLSPAQPYTIEYDVKLTDTSNKIGACFGFGQNASYAYYGFGFILDATGKQVTTHCKWWNNLYYKKGTTDRYGRTLTENAWQNSADEDGFVRITLTYDGRYMGLAIGGVDVGCKWDISTKYGSNGVPLSGSLEVSKLMLTAGYSSVGASGVTNPVAGQEMVQFKNISVYSGVADPEWDADEITITTADQFVEFQRQIHTGRKFIDQTVKLGADIDLSGKTLYPINFNQKNGVKGFQGTFDGQYHTISNAKNPSTLANGIFGSIKAEAGVHAQIKNLALMNYTASGNRLGSLYGYVNGKLTVENVYINGVVNGNNGANKEYNAGFLGNIVGIGEVTFKNCVFDGKVYASGYGASSFVGCINHEAGGSGQVAKTSNPITFENCLATGGFYNGTTVHEGGVRFFGSNWSTVNEGQVTYTNCIRYTDYYQTGDGAATPLCPGLAYIGAGFDAVTPEGYTARSYSYPIPTTLLPLFADKINVNHSTQVGGNDLTVEYYTAQEKYENGELSVRLIGAMNLEEGKTLADYNAIGFEVVALRQENGVIWNNEDSQIFNVYTSYLSDGETVTAEMAGGDYVFMYELGGIVPNKGIVTFGIKTFYVDAEDNAIYTDMYVLNYDTAVEEA